MYITKYDYVVSVYETCEHVNMVLMYDRETLNNLGDCN